MTFFSKFSAKILAPFLNRNSQQTMEEFYQHAGLEHPVWVSASANKKSFEGSVLSRELEVRTARDASMVRFVLNDTGGTAEFWKNQQSLSQGHFRENDPAATGFNSLLDLLIEKKVYQYQRKLQVLDNKTFTAAEVTTEDKALEWMKVSFMMLEKAVVQSLTDPDLLFQALFFAGKNPKSGMEEIRLIVFNLDIKFEFLDNNLLRVRIYNDKNEEFGSAKKASLEGDFNFRKREMFDEFIRLLSVVSRGFKI